VEGTSVRRLERSLNQEKTLKGEIPGRGEKGVVGESYIRHRRNGIAPRKKGRLERGKILSDSLTTSI